MTGYCNSWDVIGGLLLVQEAGGVASDFIAENGLLEAGSALACTTGLQATLRAARTRRWVIGLSSTARIIHERRKAAVARHG